MEETITIISIVKKHQEEKTREVFKNIIENFCDSQTPELKIGSPSQIPNQLLFALKISKKSALNVIKQLTFKNVSIVKNDPFIKAAVMQAKYELETEQKNTLQNIQLKNQLTSKLRRKSDYTIDELTFLKDWQLLLDLAINHTFEDFEKNRKIKDMLPEMLNEFIDTELEKGKRSLGNSKNSVENLAQIAENESLRRFHFSGSIKKAGEGLIHLCSLHPKELTNELIFLANSRTTIPEINIKSFLTFYNLVKKDKEKYDDEIKVATNHLNTRSLENVFYSVNLNEDEKNLFREGVKFFKQRRQVN
ncbi:MAG: hypothetical protein KAQ90_04660 [Melioribacteraceae bacterium]|nr:hypothetical protein [Melioribacteraceae bacterium]